MRKRDWKKLSLLFRQETDPRPKNVLRKHGSVKKTKSQNFHGEIYSIVLIAFLFHFFSWFPGSRIFCPHANTPNLHFIVVM